MKEPDVKITLASPQAEPTPPPVLPTPGKSPHEDPEFHERVLARIPHSKPTAPYSVRYLLSGAFWTEHERRGMPAGQLVKRHPGGAVRVLLDKTAYEALLISAHIALTNNALPRKLKDSAQRTIKALLNPQTARPEKVDATIPVTHHVRELNIRHMTLQDRNLLLELHGSDTPTPLMAYSEPNYGFMLDLHGIDREVIERIQSDGFSPHFTRALELLTEPAQARFVLLTFDSDAYLPGFEGLIKWT